MKYYLPRLTTYSLMLLLFVHCQQELNLKTPKHTPTQIDKKIKSWHEFILLMEEGKLPSDIEQNYSNYSLTTVHKLTPLNNYWLVKAKLFPDEISILFSLLTKDSLILEVQPNSTLDYK